MNIPGKLSNYCYLSNIAFSRHSPNTTGPHWRAAAVGGCRKGFLNESSKHPGTHFHVPPSCLSLRPVTANSSTYSPSCTSLQRHPFAEKLPVLHAFVISVMVHSGEWCVAPDARNWKSTTSENCLQVEFEYLVAFKKQVRTCVVLSAQEAGQSRRTSASVCTVHTGSTGMHIILERNKEEEKIK